MLTKKEIWNRQNCEVFTTSFALFADLAHLCLHVIWSAELVTFLVDFESMSNKQQSSIEFADIRLRECDLFELAHVLRIRPVLEEGEKGNLTLVWI